MECHRHKSEAADYTAATAKQNFASKEVFASKERFTALECNRKKVNACVKKIEYEVNRDNAQQNNIVAGESLLVENKSKMKPLERTGVKDFKQQCSSTILVLEELVLFYCLHICMNSFDFAVVCFSQGY